MKQIALPYGITVELFENGTGAISSALHVPGLTDSDDRYNAIVDGIECLILAHACAGVDMLNPTYIEGIKTAVQVAANV